jgi:hypothetical protein
MEDVSSSFFERVIVIIDTCLVVSSGSKPSSSGSHISVISVDPVVVFWWRPTILLWRTKENPTLKKCQK